MNKKNDLPLYKMHDIFKGIKKPKVNKEDINKKRKFKDTPYGKIINAIKVSKNCDLLEDQEIEREYNTFRVMQALSMNNDNIELLDAINCSIGCLDKKESFLLLLSMIPKYTTFDKFYSTKKYTDSSVTSIAEHYQVGLKEARSYIDVMGNEWAQDIIESNSNQMYMKKKRKKNKKS